MQRIYFGCLSFIAIFFTGPLLWAQDMATEVIAPVTEALTVLETVSMLQKIVEAAGSKNWALVASMIIMALVFVVKKWVLPREKKAWLPLVATGLGVAVSVATNLAMGHQGILESVLAGIFVGNAASGFWDTFIKGVPKLLNKKMS